MLAQSNSTCTTWPNICVYGRKTKKCTSLRCSVALSNSDLLPCVCQSKEERMPAESSGKLTHCSIRFHYTTVGASTWSHLSETGEFGGFEQIAHAADSRGRILADGPNIKRGIHLHPTRMPNAPATGRIAQYLNGRVPSPEVSAYPALHLSLLPPLFSEEGSQCSPSSAPPHLLPVTHANIFKYSVAMSSASVIPGARLNTCAMCRPKSVRAVAGAPIRQRWRSSASGSL